ncbi:hypothetical protein CVT26_010483 [Gymnopilus dilepis]|uniref:Uncharacterized protein n=1 Tax=Gymnopilus dilepis TaxID=231916 RepID=A0A409Y0J6_9AGAR|nr:hypothetical protein CVT26_010483 [Gymnopilus dilepis]
MSLVQSLDQSTCVNASTLSHTKGRAIIEEIVIVEASDGGQVVILKKENAIIKDPIIEVIGEVVGNKCLSMTACVNLGRDLGHAYYFIPGGIESLQDE